MKEIIITNILYILITIISSLIYTSLGLGSLESYVNNYLIYILLIYYVVTIIYLYKKNKIKEKKLPLNKYFPLISLGISIAIIYNMIIFKLIPPTSVTNNVPIIMLMISSGIVGPIFEEIIYRYIFYNSSKKKHNIKKSILINSLVFAVLHLQPVKVIYAFILGIILNIFYEKYQNIKVPILIHMSANTIVLFLNEYNTIVLILAIINLIISINLTKEIDNHNSYII